MGLFDWISSGIRTIAGDITNLISPTPLTQPTIAPVPAVPTPQPRQQLFYQSPQVLPGFQSPMPQQVTPESKTPMPSIYTPSGAAAHRREYQSRPVVFNNFNFGSLIPKISITPAPMKPITLSGAYNIGRTGQISAQFSGEGRSPITSFWSYANIYKPVADWTDYASKQIDVIMKPTSPFGAALVKSVVPIPQMAAQAVLGAEIIGREPVKALATVPIGASIMLGSTVKGFTEKPAETALQFLAQGAVLDVGARVGFEGIKVAAPSFKEGTRALVSSEAAKLSYIGGEWKTASRMNAEKIMGVPKEIIREVTPADLGFKDIKIDVPKVTPKDISIDIGGGGRYGSQLIQKSVIEQTPQKAVTVPSIRYVTPADLGFFEKPSMMTEKISFKPAEFVSRYEQFKLKTSIEKPVESAIYNFPQNKPTESFQSWLNRQSEVQKPAETYKEIQSLISGETLKTANIEDLKQISKTIIREDNALTSKFAFELGMDLGLLGAISPITATKNTISILSVPKTGILQKPTIRDFTKAEPKQKQKKRIMPVVIPAFTSKITSNVTIPTLTPQPKSTFIQFSMPDKPAQMPDYGTGSGFTIKTRKPKVPKLKSSFDESYFNFKTPSKSSMYKFGEITPIASIREMLGIGGRK